MFFYGVHLKDVDFCPFNTTSITNQSFDLAGLVTLLIQSVIFCVSVKVESVFMY